MPYLLCTAVQMSALGDIGLLVVVCEVCASLTLIRHFSNIRLNHVAWLHTGSWSDYCASNGRKRLGRAGEVLRKLPHIPYPLTCHLSISVSTYFPNSRPSFDGKYGPSTCQGQGSYLFIADLDLYLPGWTAAALSRLRRPALGVRHRPRFHRTFMLAMNPGVRLSDSTGHRLA